MHMGGNGRPYVVVTELDCPDSASKNDLMLSSQEWGQLTASRWQFLLVRLYHKVLPHLRSCPSMDDLHLMTEQGRSIKRPSHCSPTQDSSAEQSLTQTFPTRLANSDRPASQFTFLCSILLPLLYFTSIEFLINSLHPKLYFSICFHRIHPVTPD